MLGYPYERGFGLKIFKPNYLSYGYPIYSQIYLSVKMEQTECSETSAYKIQTLGNYPEENIQRREHGESLKLRINILTECFDVFSVKKSHIFYNFLELLVE
jgi:hypothetical protein